MIKGGYYGKQYANVLFEITLSKILTMEEKMRIKTLIVSILTICIMVSLCGCYKRVDEDGVSYVLKQDVYYVSSVGYPLDEKHSENIYVRDEIDGIPVSFLGQARWEVSKVFWSKEIKRVYYPWSLDYNDIELKYLWDLETTNVYRYVISASTKK